jgi:hypothetical protein
VKIRNCAWLGGGQRESAKVVWARGRAISKQCPKSVISAESLRFLDMYNVWKSLGKGCIMSLDARSAEAIELLEREWLAEKEHGKEE